MKAIICDRDGVINESSNLTDSKLYYILSKNDLLLKDGVKDCFAKLKQLNIPIVLCTRQRCISKGLITKEEVDEINKELETQLDFTFDKIFIESKSKLKSKIFGEALNYLKLEPIDCLIVDDSETQITVAKTLGFNTLLTEKLHDIFSVIE